MQVFHRPVGLPAWPAPMPYQSAGGTPVPPFAAPDTSVAPAAGGGLAVAVQGVKRVLGGIFTFVRNTLATLLAASRAPGTTTTTPLPNTLGEVFAVVRDVLSRLFNSLTSPPSSPSFPLFPLFPSPPAQGLPYVYGTGLQSFTLANTQIGGPNGQPDRQVSMRYRAPRSGTLVSFKTWQKWDGSDGRTGYGSGKGGVIEYTLQTDDGTPAHRPSGQVLAKVTVKDPIVSSSKFETLVFDRPVYQQAGQIYHIVARNLSENPRHEHISLNALKGEAEMPLQPRLDDGWALLNNDGHWSQRDGYTPILQLNHADGFSYGNGYIEVWQREPKSIGGASSVRQTMTISGPSRIFGQVGVRVARAAGDGALTMRIEQADGTLVAQAQVDARTVSGEWGWARASFDRPVALESGKSYHLVLSAPHGTRYRTFPLRDGSTYGFVGSTFSDGLAQYNEGNGWRGWDYWGKTNRKEGDLQFFFH